MSPSGPLRLRDFRLLAGSVGLSALGDWLALVALLLHVESSTGSSFALAALLVALWSPAVLLAGPAGLIADRVESRRLLLWTSVAAGSPAPGSRSLAGWWRSSR